MIQSRSASLRTSGFIGDSDIMRLANKIVVPIIILRRSSKRVNELIFDCYGPSLLDADKKPVFLIFEKGKETESGNHFDWVEVPDVAGCMAKLKQKTVEPSSVNMSSSDPKTKTGSIPRVTYNVSTSVGASLNFEQMDEGMCMCDCFDYSTTNRLISRLVCC